MENPQVQGARVLKDVRLSDGRVIQFPVLVVTVPKVEEVARKAYPRDPYNSGPRVRW